MIGTVDTLVFLLYFVAIIVIALATLRRVKKDTDYALAGRSLGWPVTIGTLVAAMIGSSAAMGKSGTAYQYGIGIMWLPIAIFVGYLIFSLFIAHRLRRANIWSVTDLLERRFGATVRRLSAIVLVIAVISIFGAQLIAMGIVFKLAGEPLGISYQIAVLFAGIVLIFYTTMGGLYAVAFTDVLQFAIMIPVLTIVLPILVFSSGEVSIPIMVEQFEPRMFNMFTGVPITLILGMLFTYIPGVIIDQSIWQRISSARNDKIARWSPMISGGIYFYFSMIVILVGMAGAIIFPNLLSAEANADAILPMMLAHFLPKGVTGLGLTALFAVAMSTASACLLISAVIVAKDIVPMFTKRETSPEDELRYSRIGAVVIGLAGVGFALTFSGIFWIMLIAYGIFVGGLFFPIIFSMFWKKATRTAAITSIIGSSIVMAIFLVLDTDLEAIIPTSITSFILMIVVSLLTYRKEKMTAPVLLFEEDRRS